jgi:surfeit locus 1 family protein
MYRLLSTPRWLAGHLLVLVLVGLFVGLGIWQLSRLESRRATNTLLETRLVAPPRAYDELRTSYDVSVPASHENAIVYRRAAFTGTFDTANEVLIRTRSLNGQPGYHVLTPFVFDEDRAILIDRGWVPYDMNTPPVEAALPPEGEMTITGILYPEQPQPESGLRAHDPPEGRLSAVFWIDTQRLQRQMPYRLEPLYMQLETQVPAQAGSLPVPPRPPELTEGSHLSYALQWFSFALIGLIGYPLLLGKVLRERQAPSPSERAASS